VMVSGSPLGSASLPSTVMVVGASSLVEVLSLTAFGDAFTRTETVAVAEVVQAYSKIFWFAGPDVMTEVGARVNGAPVGGVMVRVWPVMSAKPNGSVTTSRM